MLDEVDTDDYREIFFVVDNQRHHCRGGVKKLGPDDDLGVFGLILHDELCLLQLNKDLVQHNRQ